MHVQPRHRSRHHGWRPDGLPGIAVSPYRVEGGIAAILALSKAAGVAYDAGYPGGAMFIDYPKNIEDVPVIDQLIDEAYAAKSAS